MNFCANATKKKQKFCERKASLFFHFKIFLLKLEDMKRNITKKNDSILVGLDQLSNSKTSTPLLPKRKSTKVQNNSGICTPMVLRSQRRRNKFRVYFKNHFRFDNWKFFFRWKIHQFRVTCSRDRSILFLCRVILSCQKLTVDPGEDVKVEDTWNFFIV